MEMSRLYSFFGLNEMARPKGSFGKTMRAALEKARAYGGEFTVKQFAEWLAEEGVENPHPASVGIRLSKMTAGEGERPDALHPLIRAQAGRRGPGGTGTFLYALDGVAGYKKPDPNAVEPDDEEEAGFDDDGEDGEEAPAAPKGPPPNWVPKADPNGGWIEETMAELETAGFGPDHPMWLKIGKAENDAEVAVIMGGESISPQYTRKIRRVAQQIFTNLGKDWETGNVPTARPANTSAGDRKYDKGKSMFTGKQGDTKSKTDTDDPGMAAFLAAMSKPATKTPEPAGDDTEFGDEEPTNPDIGVGDDDFIDPDDEPAADEPAGAAQFLPPTSPPAPRGGPAPAPSAAKPTAKNMAQLMKRFTPKKK